MATRLLYLAPQVSLPELFTPVVPGGRPPSQPSPVVATALVLHSYHPDFSEMPQK